MQLLIKLLKHKFQHTKDKSNLEKKIPEATFLIQINQYIRDKQN